MDIIQKWTWTIMVMLYFSGLPEEEEFIILHKIKLELLTMTNKARPVNTITINITMDIIITFLW